jgi:hypothetical protein
MRPVEDPFAEHPEVPTPGYFRRWLERSTPVSVLLALGFCLLLVSIILSMTFGHLDRQAERKDVRSELTCRSRFTNDVTQAEGRVLAEISRVVEGAVEGDDAVTAEAGKALAQERPRLQEALRRRNVAEAVCAGRPAS